MVAFVGTSDSANFAIGLVKDTILLLAGNLNIVIPAVIAFAAATALIKVSNLIGELKALALGVTAVDLSLLPIVGAFAAGAAAALAFGVLVSSVVEKLSGGKIKLLDFNTALSGLKSAGGLVGQVVSQLSKDITDNAIATQAGKDATNLLNNTQTVAQGTVTNYTQSLAGNTTTVVGGVKPVQDLNDAHQGLGKVLRVSSANAEQLTTDLNNNAQGVQKVVTGVTALTTSQDAANAALVTSATDSKNADTATVNLSKSVEAAVSSWNDLTNAILAALAALKAYQAAGGGGVSGASGGVAAAGHARDGGTFHVTGGTGVDSKMIAVSPGEVVTVQTPAQYRAGVRPPVTAGQTHFAFGGVTTGAGVDLGSGVTTSATPSGGSTTGFSDDRSSAVGALATATTDNTAATEANTAALGGTSSGAASGTVLDNGNTSSGSTGFDLGAGPGSSPSNDNQELFIVKDGLLWSLTNNRKATTAQESQDFAAATGGDSKGDVFGASGAVYHPVRAANNGAGIGGAIIGYQDAGDGAINVSGGGSTLGTGKSSLYAGEYDNADGTGVPVSTYGHARDGADFYVPGGTGVDSKIMQVAVSPGEQVSVRTPAQQAAGAANGNSGGTVNMFITTPDASSFGQSQAQTSAKFVRALRRVSRN